jgi:hypothetical protein
MEGYKVGDTGWRLQPKYFAGVSGLIAIII